MRIVYWNIRAGGGRRVDWIATQIARWRPALVGLCEFRATPPSQRLAEALAGQGLGFQIHAVDRHRPAVNGVMLASSSALREVKLRPGPPEPTRWLLARATDGPAVGVLHAPNYVTGRKQPFFDEVRRFARRWRGGPAVFGGDTNTGIPPLDGNPAAFHDWEVDWIPALARAGWRDAYRHFHPRRSSHTWFSPNAGNGYRLDQAFVHRRLLPRLTRVRHVWGSDARAPSRRDALSDHAAVIVDFNTSELS